MPNLADLFTAALARPNQSRPDLPWHQQNRPVLPPDFMMPPAETQALPEGWRSPPQPNFYGRPMETNPWGPPSGIPLPPNLKELLDRPVPPTPRGPIPGAGKYRKRNEEII